MKQSKNKEKIQKPMLIIILTKVTFTTVLRDEKKSEIKFFRVML